MIKHAAIQHNGKVYTGKRHRDIIANSHPANDLSKGEQGFVTNTGIFVNREQAAKIAYHAGQIKKPKQSLKSEDIY